MELGAMICTPRNPTCLLCPVRGECVALATGRVDELPRPKEKKATQELSIALYLIRDRKGRVLMRRESGPLMNDPLTPPARRHLAPHRTATRPATREHIGTFRHTVTTRKIEFTVYTAPTAASAATTPTNGSTSKR